ncbi:MAG: hypothetical protein ACI9TY_001327 [Alphaproteobacteria bacterium]|jgi:hypothetical protein
MSIPSSRLPNTTNYINIENIVSKQGNTKINKTLYITLLSTAIAFSPTAQAFDLGGMITSKAEESAAASVKEQKKDMIKGVAKDTAHKAGVTEADPYIDVAVDSADVVIDSVKDVHKVHTEASKAPQHAKPVPTTKEETSVLDSIGNFFK